MSATGAGLVRYLRTLAAGQANDACTDRQLLELFVTQREETSFAALVRRHGSMVLAVCRRILRHDQDAEDAFQATFLVLARKASSIRKRESVSSWLHGVAYHVAQRLRAKEARRAVHERKAVSRPTVDLAEDVAWREVRCLLDMTMAASPAATWNMERPALQPSSAVFLGFRCLGRVAVAEVALNSSVAAFVPGQIG